MFYKAILDAIIFQRGAEATTDIDGLDYRSTETESSVLLFKSY